MGKPSLRCLAIKLYPNFQDDFSKQKMLLSDKASKLCLIKNLFSHSIYRGSCNDIFHFIEFSENERKIMRTLFLQMLKKQMKQKTKTASICSRSKNTSPKAL